MTNLNKQAIIASKAIEKFNQAMGTDLHFSVNLKGEKITLKHLTKVTGTFGMITEAIIELTSYGYSEGYDNEIVYTFHAQMNYQGKTGFGGEPLEIPGHSSSIVVEELEGGEIR